MVVLWFVPVVILLVGMAWAGWRLRQVALVVDDLQPARPSSPALATVLDGLQGRTAEVAALLDEAASR